MDIDDKELAILKMKAELADCIVQRDNLAARIQQLAQTLYAAKPEEKQS